MKNFENYSNFKQKVKQILDEKNVAFKTVLQFSRDNENLYQNEYLVLEYTTIFDQHKFCTIENQQDNYLEECPYKNCKFTCDKSLANSADSVIFHASDLPKEPTESTIYLKSFLSKTSRRKNQIWVLWHDEVSSKFSLNFGQIDKIKLLILNQKPSNLPKSFDIYKMNWTLSYLIDSEVSDCSYGCTYDNKVSDLNKINKLYSNIHEQYSNRNHSAVWFVSNCGANFRNSFAFELSDLYETRIFGRCGDQFRKKYKTRALYLFHRFKSSIFDFLTFSIFKSEAIFENTNCGRDSECERKEFKTNLFYLSFESRNCSNYITEKFWRILNTNLIPVVIQPAKHYYEEIAPKNSFIHAQDFDYDVTKLANYMRLVSSDFELYFKYHLWRLSYEAVHTAQYTEKRRFCEFCTRLNTEKSTIYYDKISDWFNKKCST